MRKINRITNIALIFMLIGIFVCQGLAYSSDATCLRVPVGIDKDRALEVISELQIEEVKWDEIKFIKDTKKQSEMSITQQAEYKEEGCFAKWPTDEYDNEHIISEAQNLRYLESKGVKNIPRVKHLLRTKGGTVIMLLENFDKGETLDKKIGKLSQDEAIDIIFKVSKIVKSLLDNGMYHWDISPNNIWITDKGEVILFDFGISFMSGSKKFIDNRLYECGKELYMSPNRLALRYKPEEYSYSQSDEIYSLGIILAQTSSLTIKSGHKSYMFKSIMAQSSERDDLKIIKPILERALSGEYDTIEEFIEDLEGAKLKMFSPHPVETTSITPEPTAESETQAKRQEFLNVIEEIKIYLHSEVDPIIEMVNTEHAMGWLEHIMVSRLAAARGSADPSIDFELNKYNKSKNFIRDYIEMIRFFSNEGKVLGNEKYPLQVEEMTRVLVGEEFEKNKEFKEKFLDVMKKYLVYLESKDEKLEQIMACFDKNSIFVKGNFIKKIAVATKLGGINGHKDGLHSASTIAIAKIVDFYSKAVENNFKDNLTISAKRYEDAGKWLNLINPMETAQLELMPGEAVKIKIESLGFVPNRVMDFMLEKIRSAFDDESFCMRDLSLVKEDFNAELAKFRDTKDITDVVIEDGQNESSSEPSEEALKNAKAYLEDIDKKASKENEKDPGTDFAEWIQNRKDMKVEEVWDIFRAIYKISPDWAGAILVTAPHKNHAYLIWLFLEDYDKEYFHDALNKGIELLLREYMGEELEIKCLENAFEIVGIPRSDNLPDSAFIRSYTGTIGESVNKEKTLLGNLTDRNAGFLINNVAAYVNLDDGMNEEITLYKNLVKERPEVIESLNEKNKMSLDVSEDYIKQKEFCIIADEITSSREREIDSIIGELWSEYAKAVDKGIGHDYGKKISLDGLKASAQAASQYIKLLKYLSGEENMAENERFSWENDKTFSMRKKAKQLIDEKHKEEFSNIVTKDFLEYLEEQNKKLNEIVDYFEAKIVSTGLGGSETLKINKSKLIKQSI